MKGGEFPSFPLLPRANGESEAGGPMRIPIGLNPKIRKVRETPIYEKEERTDYFHPYDPRWFSHRGLFT